MKPSRLITALGGVLTIACSWMPWASVLGISVNGFLGEMRGNPGIATVALGILALIFGLIGKMWSSIVTLLLGLATIGFWFIEHKSITDNGATEGTGMWMMLAGGIIILLGSIMGIAKK